MPSTSVPELQQKLFKRIGIDMPQPGPARKQRKGAGHSGASSRKALRQAQRGQKKAQRATGRVAPERQLPKERRRTSDPSRGGVSRDKFTDARHKDDEEEEVNDAFDSGPGMDVRAGGIHIDADILSDADEEEDEVSKLRKKGRTSAGKPMSNAVLESIAQDDAEINDLERKLGIKKGRKSMPRAFQEDGLADLLGDLVGDEDESQEEEEEEERSSKRKSEYDDWLSFKRRKINDDEDDDGTEDSSGEADLEGAELGDASGLDQDSVDEDQFAGFSSDGSADAAPRTARVRENPYIAPATGALVAKYVPPSLRKSSGSERESKSRLRKQVQGPINRLTDANILSIVRSVEDLYQNNARGDVTEVLTDAILAQICKPEILPDQFLVLAAGFAAAVYKIVGVSFGSHLVRRVVDDIGEEHGKASLGKRADEQSGIRKEASNLFAFLVQLYAFDVLGCKIVFDCMERLLRDLTELNVELLLRICRTVGRLLRRDDAQALKHVSSVLNKAVAKAGYEKYAARTKFMIETINDLKNSKPKARGLDSGLISEHVQRMRKRLGELKSQSRRLDGIAPMGVGLDDIEGADTRGEWWLVGASVPATEAGGQGKDICGRKRLESDDGEEEEDMDIVLPDYPKKARAQGFSTTAQVSIFTALMSATNYEHGYRQFLNLKLRKEDQLELARVLVQCVGSEDRFNVYYALVAKEACSNSKIRFALQDRLWKILRSMGESLFGEDTEDEETADGERMKDGRRTSNVAQFYAFLVAEGALNITILKPLELPEVSTGTSAFVERMLVSILQACRGQVGKVDKVFEPVKGLPVLAAGLHWFLRKRVSRTRVVGASELRRLEGVKEELLGAIRAVEAAEG